MRDVEKLFNDYKPLILKTYKKYYPRLKGRDREDLLSQIKLLFYELVLQYDPSRGVDFPYYIQYMLDRRTYHYVQKQIKREYKETLIEGFTNGQINFVEDIDNGEEFKKVENLLSWDDDFSLGTKQKDLFIKLLKEKKDIHEVAKEENVKVSTIHTRLHFLIKKLNKQREIQESLEESN